MTRHKLVQRTAALSSGVLLGIFGFGISPANAQSQTTTLGNGCRITGSNDSELDGPLGTRYSKTDEANLSCSELEAKIRCQDPNTLAYITLTSSYLNTSHASKTCFTRDVVYTDHNGAQVDGVNRQGFRLNDVT